MSETTNLKLFKHNNPSTNENQFDVDLALNQNWDKIDDAYGNLNKDVENLQTNDTEQDELISKLRNAALNAETEKAKSLHVTDANRFGSLEILGNQEQEIRSGKNKFIPLQTGNNSGIAITKNTDGTYNINGTATARIEHTAFVNLNESGIENGLTYILSSTKTLPEGVTSRVEMYNGASWLRAFVPSITSTVSTSTGVANTTDATRVRFGIFIESGTTINIQNLGFQLEKGTVATEYEQYGASPSPDYPSEVKCLEGSVKIINLNKNKFIPLQTGNNSGIAITKNTDGTYNINGTATARIEHTAFVNLNESGIENGLTYILSSTKTLPEGVTSRVEMYNGASWLRAFVPNITSTVSTSTGVANTTDATRVRFGIFIESGTTINIQNLGFQLEKGTVATNFVEHKRTDYLLYIQQEMLSGDCFIKESDGWKEVHSWNKKVLTASDNFLQSEDNCIYLNNATNSADYTNLKNYSNCYLYNSNLENMRQKTEHEFTLQNYASRVWFNNKGTEIENVEAFKTYLEANDIYFWYKTTTLTKLPCTEAQSAVLEELSNLDLFDGVNNIITAEDIALLKLKYALDVETYIDNKLNTINQQILEIAGGN